MKTISSFLFSLACLVTSTTSFATLIGTDVNVIRSFQGTEVFNETQTVVDGGDPEFLEQGLGGLSLDITADSIIWNTGNNIGTYGADPHFYLISDLDLVGGILDINFTVSGITGLTESDVTFGFDWVRVDIASMATVADAFWDIGLISRSVSAPEPSTLLLLSLGLLGIGFMRTKKI